MRRFSFQIDLTGKDRLTAPAPSPEKSAVPRQADGFEMSSALTEQVDEQRWWPGFQRDLYRLPEVADTLEEWDNPNLAAEYVRIYRVTKDKVLEAEPGTRLTEKLHTNCFFAADGTKHLVTRLTSQQHERLNEIRLAGDGTLVRLYYEKTHGAPQNLDSLFERGLLGLEEDHDRFSKFPNYVLRFFLFVTEGEYLKSTFRGVTYFDLESETIVTQEAEELA